MTLRVAATKVVTVLQQAGFTAYWAGGCVRDEVLGREPSDYDVATDARPDQVRRLFRHSRAVGESFGVMLVSLARHRIEVATFRTEWGYTDHRRPDGIEFSDAEHDARRRDFTINGLFKDPVTGEVIDYVGGLDDLKAGIIRAIGDPVQRLDEDHLRALRAVRFAARFGYRIDEQTAAVIRGKASDLAGVSRERIGIELAQMLTHPSRAEAVRWMQALTLDAPVLMEQTRNLAPRVLNSLGDQRVAFGVALSAWAVDRAVDTDPMVDQRWRRALKLSNHHQRVLSTVLRDLPVVRDRWPGLPTARKKRLAAQQHFHYVLEVLAAMDRLKAATITAEIEALSAHAGGLAPEPFVDGRHLIEHGLTPGPDFKRILDMVYDAQLEGSVTTVRQALALAMKTSKSSDSDGNKMVLHDR